jgi:hypothetical protein
LHTIEIYTIAAGRDVKATMAAVAICGSKREGLQILTQGLAYCKVMVINQLDRNYKCKLAITRQGILFITFGFGVGSSFLLCFAFAI